MPQAGPAMGNEKEKNMKANKYMVHEIAGIQNAKAEIAKAKEAAYIEGNDFCSEALEKAEQMLDEAMSFAISCERGEECE